VIIVEAKISPADIAFIANGQSASVKLDAYDYAIFGAMQGEVTYISADTLSEETRQGPVTYYRVLIRINGNEYKAKAGDQIKIRPGMTASVDIKAMERTVLSYLTKPVTKTLGQSLGER
jgi:membrane fusion protein, adhesin transport system